MAARLGLPSGHLLDTPGPGAYRPTAYTLKSFPTVGFKTEQRGKLEAKPESPGPAAYLPSVEQVKEHFPEVKIGTATRPKPANADTPAPGEYDHRTVFDDNLKNNRGPSLSSRYQKLAAIDSVPGPGEYQPEVRAVKVRAASCRQSSAHQNRKAKAV